MPMTIASKELRLRAIEAYKTGAFTQQQLANAFRVHYKTIQNWLRADANGEDQTPKQRGCRPRVFNKEEENELVLLVRDNPSITLEEIKVKFKKNCNTSVVHRTLLRLGITYKKNSSGIGARSRRYKESA